jgi:hypothetical protein
MKIECSCGITYQVYDYPPTMVEIDKKPVAQRHIMCPCDREVVIHTQPKYEPAAAEGEDAENTSGVVSFDELVRRLNQDAKQDPAPAKSGGWGGYSPTQPPPAGKAPSKAAVAPPPLPSIIVDPNAAPIVNTDEKSIFLSQDEADTVGALIANYGEKFKDPEVQKEEVQEFADLAARARQEGMLIISEKEQRMCRMAFLDRNVKKLWPIAAYAPDDEYEVVQQAKAKALRLRFKATCGWDN